MVEAKTDKKPEAPQKAEVAEKKSEKKFDRRHEKPQEKEKKEDKIAHRVRVAGVILDGSLEVTRALTGIKGIGIRVARSLHKALEIKKGVKLSSLNEKEIEELESMIAGLDQKLPVWMLNHRKDVVTGKNVHLLGPELDITNRSDIDRHKKIRSYRGVRHTLNLPVRGQRTRSSFRTGGTIGVVRKKEMPAAAGEAKKKEETKK
ncbi:MAG: 30S ribosomal protein S13 [Candidatus Altiarchaeales archaeon]|nr:30S ribosomal protein S13 [Candidatus Altiarchaeales archaeon]